MNDETARVPIEDTCSSRVATRASCPDEVVRNLRHVSTSGHFLESQTVDPKKVEKVQNEIFTYPDAARARAHTAARIARLGIIAAGRSNPRLIARRRDFALKPPKTRALRAEVTSAASRR